MQKHVVVSLSGGMDSSTLLLRCLKEYDTVTAISFDYGQKHRVELERAQLLIDYSKIGWDITAFLGIYLDKSSLYEDVAKQLEQIPEVVNIHYTTGIYSIFAKIICRDTQHLREVLHDKIQRVTGIQRTETFISLEESLIRNTPLL
jgi:Lrp/AsnC family transcriptional regulator for asnA, asnC and gidA